jgi:hypothetical protein
MSGESKRHVAAKEAIKAIMKTKSLEHLERWIMHLNASTTGAGVYVKLVTQDELNLNLKLMKLGICPTVLAHSRIPEVCVKSYPPVDKVDKVDKVDRLHVMVSELYDITLSKYFTEYLGADGSILLDHRVLALIDAKLGAMHSANVAHLDTHLENFVFNIIPSIPDGKSEATKEAKILEVLRQLQGLMIIDFGCATELDNSLMLKRARSGPFWRTLRLTSSSTFVDADLTRYRYDIHTTTI